jgi:hypothetical protein
MIDRIEFTARYLTSNAGLLLLLENTRKNGVFDWIDQELVFETRSTNQIKRNHIQTLLCGNFIGIDKLERLKLLQGDPLVREYSIAVKEPETVSRFLGNFNYKTTQMLREIYFRLFRKLLQIKRLPAITIDIDSSVVNVEGHQEGTTKGYNPKKPGNPCYNLQFAFCDEIKAFLSGYICSEDTYTSNGAAGLIQEIVAQIQELSVKTTFRMDSGYFDEAILETIETMECTYVIKAKGYPTLVSKASDPGLTFVPGEDGRETAELYVKRLISEGCDHSTWISGKRRGTSAAEGMNCSGTMSPASTMATGTERRFCNDKKSRRELPECAIIERCLGDSCRLTADGGWKPPQLVARPAAAAVPYGDASQSAIPLGAR